MCKFLLLQITKRISLNNVLLMPSQVIMQNSIRLCSFCNFYHGKVSKLMHHQIRTNTTTTNLLHLSVMKKRNRQRRLYAELLEITNERASNKKTTIQKIKASNISVLVGQDNIADKSPQISSTLNNNSDHCQDQCITSDLNTCKENHDSLKSEKNFNIESIENTLSKKMNYCKQLDNDKNTFSDSSIHIKKNNCQVEKKTHCMINNRHATDNYIETLLAHMQVYLNCNMLHRTNRILMKYRKSRNNNLQHNKKCIELYNIILEAYASKKDIKKVLDLYTMIKNDSLIPTEQTFIYLFDAVGRNSNTLNTSDVLTNLQSEMKSYNISFNDIINKGCFKHDQHQNVLKVIQQCEPDFKPSYTGLNLGYMCSLVNKVPMMNNYCSPLKNQLTMNELKNCAELQFQLEKTTKVQIKSIINPDINMKTVSAYRHKVTELENYWKRIALVAFERNLKCLKETENHSYNALMVLYPFLEVLNKKHYINAIIQEARKVASGSATFSMTLNSLHITLGRHIYDIYEIQYKEKTGVLDKIHKIYQKYLEWYLHPKSINQFNNMNNRTVWEYFEQQEKSSGASLNATCFNWPKEVITNIGKFLYKIILNDLILKPDLLKGQDIKSSIPAFYTLFRSKDNYLAEQIKPHPIISKMYKEAQSEVLSFNTNLVPSNAPPRPWTSIVSGGYFLKSTDFIRVSGSMGNLWKKFHDTPSQQLYPVFDSLNQLGSTPWTINCPILDIVTEIFQKGGCPELNIPQSISKLTAPPRVQQSATVEEKRQAAIAMAKYEQRKRDDYSLWCDALYKLSLANHFRNKIFWLPHNLDFRGRVYPIPPHLNHLASDLSRSLLLFAESKPLGPKGLDWLKLHVINLTSKKKSSSVKERLEYANENLENILDSAFKPLTGKMWWKESEEPWQTLAGCMEIANALKAPNVEEYESRFPIHQDGSCNGLQHYAALGRDQIGAESVNLCPFDVPKDIYSTVAALVEKTRKIDAANKVIMAKALDGFIQRKVIKQTVMTTVYGVTKYGAKCQILKQLKVMEKFPEEHLWTASVYLTEKTFSSLRTMFKSAKEIQDWFTLCARAISVLCGENVEWVTPLGLPIIQPYVKQLKKLKNKNKNEVPDTLKQKNAFAPNFIHSLDSTHMMLTSLHSKEAGITFVSVHDCFWTHASTVDIMNKICREQFVALHTEPILENLATFFVNRYISTDIELKQKLDLKQIRRTLTNVPAKGSFDINNVLSSTYFFS
ncbi:mitochondrial RNA polymerase isoform X2 [Nomia melanderi]|uniref:mitochondrial RNA polymerase isoform X2 n=1 Tax=Nomia melanderi TaxID=2448451 RepID=UPI003FCCDE48